MGEIRSTVSMENCEVNIDGLAPIKPNGEFDLPNARGHGKFSTPEKAEGIVHLTYHYNFPGIAGTPAQHTPGTPGQHIAGTPSIKLPDGSTIPGTPEINIPGTPEINIPGVPAVEGEDCVVELGTWAFELSEAKALPAESDSAKSEPMKPPTKE